ncbi:hypothetical protein [Bacillus alkalicellulosilyticus]|uniref:hypothetical protein n=1 Tax=Alkalihalobacterium alkalicellulosilyticum TaxID=1912214 RepID=UPI0009980B19|nr:hypothetical protein [Bacillus alkalicellulosilyticus]
MNIRSAFVQSNKILEPIFELEIINNQKILQCLVKSWNCIEKFSKNIDSKSTRYFENQLEILNVEDLPITNEMLLEASTIFNHMKEEANNDVKIYLDSYFKLLKTLLIFNKPFSECCKTCHYNMYYYFDENTHHIIKECDFCGALFLAATDENVTPEFISRLRPAKKNELLSYL